MCLISSFIHPLSHLVFSIVIRIVLGIVLISTVTASLLLLIPLVGQFRGRRAERCGAAGPAGAGPPSLRLGHAGGPVRGPHQGAGLQQGAAPRPALLRAAGARVYVFVCVRDK